MRRRGRPRLNVERYVRDGDWQSVSGEGLREAPVPCRCGLRSFTPLKRALSARGNQAMKQIAARDDVRPHRRGKHAEFS